MGARARRVAPHPRHRGAGGGRPLHAPRPERRRGEPAARRPALERDAAAHEPAGGACHLPLVRPRDAGARPPPVARELPRDRRTGVRPVPADGARGDGGGAGGGVKYSVRLGDRTVDVEVDGTRVTMGGETLDVQLAALPGTPLRHLLVGGASWTVAVPPGEEPGRRALGPGYSRRLYRRHVCVRVLGRCRRFRCARRTSRVAGSSWTPPGSRSAGWRVASRRSCGASTSPRSLRT